MRKKFSKEQLDILIKCLNTDGFTPPIVESLLSADNLKNTYQYLQELALDEDMSEEESEIFSQFDDVMIEDFALQIAKKDFSRISEVEDKEKRALLVEAILNHPEEYEEKITNDEAFDLIVSTENIEYMHKWLILSKDVNGKFGPEFSDRLRLEMDRLEQEIEEDDIITAKREGYKPMYGDDVPEEKGTLGYVPPIQRRYEDFNGHYDEGFVFDQHLLDLDEGEDPLNISEKEKNALMIYEGSSPGGCAAGADSNSYKTLNTVMFSGIDNELTRIFDDHQKLNPTVLFQTKEMLDYYHNLHSTMYKYSHQIDKQVDVRRVDRTQSFDEILKKKELVSSFSTTLNYFPTEFSKKNITLVEAHIMPGAMSVDFEKVLGDEYSHYMEREVLVGFGSPVEIEEIVPQENLKTYEKDIKAIDGAFPDQKIVMRVLPLPKPKEPTQKEIEQNEKNKQFILNYGNRDRVATFMARVGEMGLLKIPKARAMEIIPQEEIDFYLKWKDALRSVITFDRDQTILEIDKQVEEYRKSHEEKVEKKPEVESKSEVQPQVETTKKEEPKTETHEEDLGYSKFKEPDFDEKQEEKKQAPVSDIQTQSSEIAKQMISEYKQKYGPRETGAKSKITIEQLDGLAKTRRLSRVNRAITSFKESIGQLVGGKKPVEKPQSKKDDQKKNDDTGR